APPTLRIPVEAHPDTLVLIGITKDVRTLGPVLLPLLSALGREDIQEAIEILNLCRRQDHLSPPLLSSAPPLGADGDASLCPGRPEMSSLNRFHTPPWQRRQSAMR